MNEKCYELAKNLAYELKLSLLQPLVPGQSSQNAMMSIPGSGSGLLWELEKYLKIEDQLRRGIQ